ncbi:DedA family protein [Dactylosporangium sp. AC04546]|uniref:DedA family protein n=1 Tax=Dactylosporangium sp. AC04546 TaxID=2862460 RepID=UPI0027DF4BB3|nr:DedA family protein [Dactylosporangium sp. AC04546]WVK83811.1 DedA family protein [Dactylosporangium sp. AC04546]
MEEKTRAFGDLLSLNPLDAKGLLSTFGVIGVWIIMFAETGLLVGFFLPGDSLLFLAGVASSPAATDLLGTKLSLTQLLIGAPICAIAGAQLGHFLGARYGRKMFDRPNSRIFKKEYVEKAEHYFAKFGPAKAVVLARFIPIVRTFLNPVAGVVGMPARQFFIWNVIGGILWTDGIIFAGWALAKQIRDLIPPEKIDTYLLPAVLLIVLVSALPIFIEIFKGWREKRRGGGHAAPAAAESGIAQATQHPAGPARGTASVPGAQSAPGVYGSPGANGANGAQGGNYGSQDPHGRPGSHRVHD